MLAYGRGRTTVRAAAAGRPRGPGLVGPRCAGGHRLSNSPLPSRPRRRPAAGASNRPNTFTCEHLSRDERLHTFTYVSAIRRLLEFLLPPARLHREFRGFFYQGLFL